MTPARLRPGRRALRRSTGVAAVVASALAMSGCGGGPAPGPFLYVANFGNNSVTAYFTLASGNAPPFKTYQGSTTSLNGPAELVVDSNHTLYVTDDSSGTPAVVIYANVNGGNVAPTNIIQGSATGLSSPRAIALDASGNIWVANYGSNTINAYAPSGPPNRAPIQTVTAGVSQPVGVGVYNGFGPYNNCLFVLNTGPKGPSITIYANMGAGGAAPFQTIAGSATTLSNPQGLAVDVGGNIWVSEYDADAVLFFAGGNQANGNVAPWVILQGPSTGLSGPKGVFVDSTGKVYVANARNTSVTVYDSAQFISHGLGTVPPQNVSPLQDIQGTSTGLNHIIGLTIG